MKNLANLFERIPTEIMSISDRMKIVFVTFSWLLALVFYWIEKKQCA